MKKNYFLLGSLSILLMATTSTYAELTSANLNPAIPVIVRVAFYSPDSSIKYVFPANKTPDYLPWPGNVQGVPNSNGPTYIPLQMNLDRNSASAVYGYWSDNPLVFHNLCALQIIYDSTAKEISVNAWPLKDGCTCEAGIDNQQPPFRPYFLVRYYRS